MTSRASAQAQQLQAPYPLASAAPTAGGGAVSASLLATVLYVCAFFAYVYFWPISRHLGVPALAALLAAALLSIVCARRAYLPGAMIALPVLAGVYVALSFAGVLPAAWTQVYDRGAIAQQSVGYIAMPILVSANVNALVVLARYPTLVKRVLVPAGVIGGLVLNPLVLTLFGEPLEGGHSYFLLNSFSGAELILTALIGWWVFHALSGVAPFLAVPILIVLTTHLNTALAFLALLVFRTRRLLVLGSLAGVLLFLATGVVAPLFWEPLLALDANNGIRAVFWGDAWLAVRDTWGVGVGFGREAIRGVYYFYAEPWSLKRPDEPDFLFIGVHNAVVQAGYRLGILGAVLVVLLIVRLRPRRSPRTATEQFDAWLFFVFVMVVCSNVAITGMYHLPGVTAVWAWLALRNDPACIRTFAIKGEAHVGPTDR
ncbi:O-antigen ligase family protein [Salinarimonas rosea]|uniref:O-antigen ligase family protein n=1 Tax=Salinarimonas rosea TaxID=552063 RepID=UPI0003F7D6B2|nr:O-antigen ligase family protein [Salinarimonas rosea]